jgi:hypothetical protein
MTYECEICYAINHAKKFQCSSCGTVPAHYSFTGKPLRLLSTEQGDMINSDIPVVAAIGVDRTERHRTCKRVLRTVPADYYASLD